MRRFLTLTVSILLGLSAQHAWGQGNEHFKISEVLVENTTGLTDEYGDRGAWIEITNTSWSSINLGGCYLTDNPAVLDETLTAAQRISMMSPIAIGDPQTKVSPRQQIVFFADGKTNLGTLHLNFVLQGGRSNFIAFYDGNGETLLDSVTVPPTLGKDQSWACFYDESKNRRTWKACSFDEITPKAANDNFHKKGDKVGEFKEKDPYGVTLSLMAMGIVFGSILLLFIVFVLFSKISDAYDIYRHGPRNHAASPADAATMAAISLDLSENDATWVAIGLALHEYSSSQAHDPESGIITIRRQGGNRWNDHGRELQERTLKQ